MKKSSPASELALIKTASQAEASLIEEYQRLNERCDLIISKIKKRKNQTITK